MKTSRLGKLLVGLAVAALMVLAAWGQQTPRITDIGDLDKEAAEEGVQEAVLALRGPQLPDAAAVRRHAPAHRRPRSTPGPSAAASARRTPTASPRGRNSIASMGERVRLSRPLDFLVVADHSDGLGFFPQLLAGDPNDARRPARAASGTT